MAELGCGRTCMKYILFVFNLIFFLLGVAALGLGIWAVVDKNKMLVLTKVGADNTDFNVAGLLESAAYVLIAGGAFVLILGFLGCCGAVKENQCMLCLYGVFLILIMAVQIAAVVLAAMYRGKAEDEVKHFLKREINSTYEGKINTANEFSLAIDFAQVYFECCGIESYSDFQGATKWNKTTSSGVQMKIPPTCCKLSDRESYLSDQSKATLEDSDCPVTENNSNKDKPCWNSIKDWLMQRIGIVIGIAVGIAVVELCCIIFACCIISALRSGKD